MDISKKIQKLERQIERTKRKIEDKKASHTDIINRGGKLTYHAGRNLGLLEGYLSAYENALDLLTETDS